MGDNGLKWTNDTRRLGDLIPWRSNPRQIKEREAGRLLDSLERFGQVQTIAIGPDNDIYDGHQRKYVWAAAAKYGPDFEVDVRVSSRPLTERERQQLAVYLHEGATGEWNFDELANWDVEVDDLVEWGFTEEKLGLAGFDFGDEPAPAPEAQIDRAAELQEKWQVEAGQVWQAGEHFVICGDCREAETWERLLAMAKVDKVNGVFTSPPYAEQRKKQYGGVPVDQYVEWWEAVQGNVRANLASDGSFFVNIKPHCEDGERVLYVFDLVLAMRRRWEWRFVDELCWLRRGYPGGFMERFRNAFEPIYHFVADGALKFRPDNVLLESSVARGHSPARKSYAHSGRTVFAGSDWAENRARPTNVLNIKMTDALIEHHAPFPVALPDFFVRAYSDPADIWADPFLGSGTVIVAAHQNERRGLGIEILPRYVSVTLERLSDMGLEPRLVKPVGE